MRCIQKVAEQTQKKDAPFQAELRYDYTVVDMNSIQAILLTYEASDEARFLAELEGWCAVSPSLAGASETRRVEWLAARVALKRLLGLFSPNLVLSPESTEPYPVLEEAVTRRPSMLSVSWGHTHHCAVVGVSTLPFGVDVEAMDRSVSKVLNRIASPKEVSRTQKIHCQDGQPAPSGLALWCGKEAMAKATGLGMKWGLKNFELLSESGGAWLVKVDKEGPRKIPSAAVGFFRQGQWLVAFAGSHPQISKGPVWN